MSLNDKNQAVPVKPREGPASRHWLWAALAAGLIFRIAYLISMRGHPLFEPLLPGYDMTVFHEWAKRIAGGQLSSGGPFYQAPLYPYLLGALYALVGPSELAAKIFQAFLGTASLGLLYLLGKRLFGPRTALTAAWLMALTPIFPFYECFLLADSLITFLNLALLAAFAGYNPEKPRRRAAACGFLLGLAALARPNILVLLPVGLYWIWRSLEGKAAALRLKAAGVFFLVTFLTISPATINNAINGRSWALVSANFHENWRIGNSYDSTGGFWQPQKGEMPVLSADFLRLQLKKLWMLTRDYEQPNNVNFYQIARENLLLRLPLSWGVFLAFGLAGIVATRKSRGQLFPLYAYLLLYGASLVAFFITSRYRVPLWPVLILFSAAFLTLVAEQALTGKYLIAALSLLLPSTAALLLVRGNGRTIQPQYFDNVVLICQKRGDDRGAAGELSRKLELYPDDPATLWQLAYYLQKVGRKEEASTRLDRLLTLVGEQPLVLRDAGLLDLELGNPERGKNRLRRYLDLDPSARDSLEIREIISSSR